MGPPLREAFEQQLDVAAIDTVALHQDPDQGV
jgi:hypothetical protein